MARRLAGLLLAAALGVSGLMALAPIGPSAAAAPSGPTWTQVADLPTGCGGSTPCTSSPPGGAGASMAYDPATNQLVLFGSNGNSTWVWSGTTWTQVDDSSDPGCTFNCTDSPPSKNTFGMAYDPASRAIVIFGSNDFNDTWAWNGTSWSQVADAGSPGCTTACPNSPPGTYGTQMAYDTATNQMVLFGGGGHTNFNDTWILSYASGTYSWAQVADAGSPGCTVACPGAPPGRNVAQLTYDPATGQLVLWGGEVTAGDADGTNATWLWNGTGWNQVDDGNGADAGCGESWPTANPCPSSPPGRVGFGMAYDPALQAVVVFGGMNRYSDPEYNDTWAWNGTIWTQVADATDPGCVGTCTDSPPARDTLAMADDAGSNQLVVFGGGGFNDTWAAAAAPQPASDPSGGAAVAATPGGQGYWVVSPTGAVSAYGDAKYYGSMTGRPLNAPIDGIASTPDGDGYWLVASDGGVFSFGDASFHGSIGGAHLNQPVVDITSTPTGDGYWLVASDGGVFSFGDASFHGSMGGEHLNQPVVGLASTRDGQGYLLVASDGGVFNYGDATFSGSAVGRAGASGTVGIFDTAGAGYSVVVSSGTSYGFGGP